MAVTEYYDYLVLGAGLSGLSAGYALQKHQAHFAILEASQRAGGVIESQKRDNFVVESGANSMVLTPEIEQLCKELGIENQIIHAAEESKIRQILWDDQLHTLKASPLTLISTNILSWGAKLRILKEPFIKTTSPVGESVLDFFTRRFGKQVATRLAGAIVSGIYAGDPEKLEMAAVFPRFVELEKEYGSLLKGLRKAPTASRKIVSFRNGMESLPIALSRKLNNHLHYNFSIKAIYKKKDSWIVEKEDGTILYAKNVISTLPAYVLEKVMRPADFPILDITYNPMLTIQVKTDLAEIQQKTTGFGFLASAYERKDFIGVLFNAHVFKTGIDGDRALMTFFVRPDHCDSKDTHEILEKICIPNFKRWTGVEGSIEMIHSRYWDKAIPQKEIGHSRLVEAIQQWENEHTGFHLAGNFIHGVSLGDCIEAPKNLVNQLLHSL